MRKLRLLLASFALLLGLNVANAYSTDDLTTAGWTQVTDISSLTLSDNYFVFVDAGASATALAVGNPATNDRPSYTTLANPFATSQQVWIIAATGDKYTMQSLVNNKYFISGDAGWNDSMSDNDNMGDFTFTLNDGKYTISRSTGNVGPWNDNGAVTLKDGYENAAVNKGAAAAPGFFVYAISRTAYNAARRNGAKLAAEGWSQVTAANGLGLSGYFYALLDVSEAGYESGFAVTGATGGRPQSKALTDPITNKSQLWTLESHGNGFALKCAEDNKYFFCDGAGWNTGFTDNINANSTEFSFALNDGKWTLSNTVEASSFMGRWGNSVFHPFDGESIAANKAASAGKKQYLIYSIPTIAGVATALPEGGDMAADTWYYIDITAAADNYTATATTLDDIIYTTDGTTLVKNAASITAKFAATDNSLSASRYYVKSSSANKLTIGVASYTYSVSEATADVAYIQPGNTVTVSFTVSSNDPAATLKKDFTDVTFNDAAIACTATDNGFTFVVPAELAANSEFTLSIPASAIGYEANNTLNAAQSITLKTPAVFDGTYFFKVDNGVLAGQYLSRGKNYGTHATIDKYGLAIKVATDGQNKTTLKPFDTDRFYRMDTGNTWDFWADNTPNDDRAKFNLVANDGHILVHGIMTDQADDYFKYNEADAGETTKIWGDSKGVETATQFTLQTAAEHAAAMQALKDAQAATAAAAAFASGKYASLEGITTVAALNTASANLVKTDVVAATTVTSVTEKYQGNQPGGDNNVETVFSGEVNIAAPGFYKFSLQAYYRAGNNSRTQEMHTANIDRSPVVLFFGNAETQIKSLYDEEGSETVMVSGNDAQYNGQYYANNTTSALMMLQAGKYTNDVWVYIAEAGTYNYGVKYLGYANANSQWFIYSPQSVSISSYAAPVIAEIVADPVNESTVESLSSVTLTFNGATTVDEGTKASDITITSDKGYSAGCSLDYGDEDNQMIVSFTEVTEPATYTITFPENAFSAEDAIVPAFTLTYTIAAPQQAGLALTPAAGNVTWLTDIVVDYTDLPEGKYLYINSAAKNKPYILTPDEKKVAVDSKRIWTGGSVYVCHLYPRQLLSEAGEYTLVIPDSVFYYQDDSWNNVYVSGTNAKYNVAAGQTQEFTSVPSKDTPVSRFKTVTITFPNATTVASASNSSLGIVLYRNFETWVTEPYFTYNGNEMSFTNFSEIIDAGHYSLNFPDGCLLIDGEPNAPFMVEFDLVENEPLNMAVTPAQDAAVEGILNSATITFPDETDVTYNSNTISLYRIEGEKEISVGSAYGAATTVKQDDGKTFKVTFNGMATKTGTYKIKIPKNLFATADRFNAETEITFTYTAPAAPTMVVTPAEGAELDRVQTFTVTFPDVENVTVNTALSGSLTLYKGVPYYNEYGYIVATSHSTATFASITAVEGKTNEFTFSFSNPGIEAGDYTLTIPAGVFLVGNTTFNATDTLTYTATGNGLDKIVATPSQPVPYLQDITLTFTNETSVMFQTAYASVSFYKVNPGQTYGTYKESISAQETTYAGRATIDEYRPNRINIKLKNSYTEEGEYYIDLTTYFLFMSDGKTPNTVNKIYFTIDPLATAIDGVQSKEAAGNDRIYTIGGTEVKSMNQPGLYIKNGKKVIKK